MNVTRSVAVLSAALLSTAALADDVGKNKPVKNADQKFQALDRNEDRQISQSEASKDDKLSATFAAVDSDGDGYLSKPEYTAQLNDKNPQQATDRSGY
jgi:Ca2+-binding EF-hand superfamily protein